MADQHSYILQVHFGRAVDIVRLERAGGGSKARVERLWTVHGEMSSIISWHMMEGSMPLGYVHFEASIRDEIEWRQNVQWRIENYTPIHG